ncbi:MAG: Bacterial CdiA-CT RNAse domain [Actinomycetota bacterium]|nr:Bacterial CdiA-CT RNAse domain [Actinomycetota bacterium]
MTTLTSCDIGAVERAAWVLAQCADRTADATTACARAARATWHWRGPAQRSFDASLTDLQGRFKAIESAHQEAAGVIRQYVGALALAMDRARSADAMDREADALSAAFRRASAAAKSPLCGPDPGEAVRAHAARLRREAVDQEEIAASLAAEQLEGLARRAPAARRFDGANRFGHDFAHAVGGSLLGLAQLAVLGGESVGIGNRENAARGELWQATKDSWKLWQPFEDMWHDGTGGRPGAAFGTAATMLTTKQRLRMSRWIRDPHIAHLEAVRQLRREALLEGHLPYTQTADDMGRNGISLINEEKRGGHVIREHVGAGVGYLKHRISVGRPAASTFDDLDIAERAVNAVLLQNKDKLHEVYALTDRRSLELTGYTWDDVGDVLLPGASHTVRSNKILVVLQLKGGEPYVVSAYPEL